jgi:hypothetical protein
MPFNPLDYPSVMAQPRLLTEASAWVEHIPFAFALVRMARPGVLVELGTYMGDSYCAFCQAVDEAGLETRCHAVDSWRGDPHTGGYPQQVLDRLRAHHEPLYARFSELVQSEFDAAVGRFEDGTIDLLHIDGLHTYEAVRHDFETWRPKLSRRAVVLFHDTREVQQDFGVYRLWAEVAAQFPSFEFEHGHGLGVLAVGPAAPEPLLDFLRTANERPAEVRGFFAELGRRLDLQRTFRAVVNGLHHQQGLVNQWKRHVGMPVEPASEQLEVALSNPLGYASYAIGEVLALANDDLRVRHEAATTAARPT